MTVLEEALLALAPGIAKLLATAIASEYDKDAELKAMLEMQRALADARVRRLLATPAPT